MGTEPGRSETGVGEQRPYRTSPPQIGHATKAPADKLTLDYKQKPETGIRLRRFGFASPLLLTTADPREFIVIEPSAAKRPARNSH